VMSKTDAFQIKKLREAGAIMLAKSNMAEFAFDPGCAKTAGREASTGRECLRCRSQ
jgi:Asp-tRNA(Asn)/Glu-tRNA(Gln) amidotransferase A subunit family amidase